MEKRTMEQSIGDLVEGLNDVLDAVEKDNKVLGIATFQKVLL